MGLLQTRPTRANGTDKVRPQMDEYDRMTKVYQYYLLTATYTGYTLWLCLIV
jgi:hypothetical protein